MEFLRWLSTRDVVGFDTESTGINVDIDRVRMVQFGDDHHGWSIPFERWGGVVATAVARYTGIYVAHNSPFDYRLCYNEGIKLPKHKMRNTRMMAHVLSSTDPLALKILATKHVDPRAAIGQQELDKGMNAHGYTWATVPADFEPYWFYGGLDPVLTYQLDQMLYPRVMAEAPYSYDLEVATEWVCEKMERRGVLVDQEYVKQFESELLEFMESAEQWCQQWYGVHPGANSKIIPLLQRDGVVLTKRTKGGALSLDKEVLSQLDSHPLARAVWDHRRASQAVGTYLRNYIKFSARDGFIHTRINTVGGTNKNPFEPGGAGQGVRTGRMSSSDPNLQNVTTRGVFGSKIRNSFISREEHTWIKADADQIESRIFATRSRDRGMLDAFQSPEDFFVVLARQIFNDPTLVKSDKRRQPTKNSIYAKLFSAGPTQFARTAGMRLPDGQFDIAGATRFLHRLDQLYPGISRYAKEIERTALQNLANYGEAFIRSPRTNRKYVADRNKLYPLLNHSIQGEAGEILKLKIVQMDAAGLGEWMTLPVHDEINLDVPNAEVKDALHILRNTLNDDTLLAVPLTWSVAIGHRWGSLEEV
jgi:DNA polymerase-1